MQPVLTFRKKVPTIISNFDLPNTNKGKYYTAKEVVSMRVYKLSHKDRICTRKTGKDPSKILNTFPLKKINKLSVIIFNSGIFRQTTMSTSLKLS